MKILWLNWRDIKNPQSGGAEVMTHETAKRLVKAGHQVTIFTSEFAKSKKFEKIDGIAIIRRGNRLTCRFWAFLEYKRKFAGKIDLAIDEINTIPFFTNFYVQERKIALIHQLAREYWWFETFFPLSLAGFILEDLYLRLYRRIPTIAASNSTRKDLEKLGFGEVYVFHQGLTFTPAKKLPAKPAPAIILFIGRSTKPKGPQDAILAFARICQAIKNAKLTMCVRGTERAISKLKKLAKKLKIENSVEILGSVNLDKKKELLKKASVVLIPSLREGWGLVAVEANSFGAVPVGYNVAGLVDSIQNGKTGILTEKNNPDYLAKAAISILSNNILYTKLAKNGLTWAKKFNWGRTYISFNQILAKIPLKILWLSWRDIKNPDAGGAEKVTIETSSRLVRDGTKVTIFTSSFKSCQNHEIVRGVEIIRRGNPITCRFFSFFYYLTHSNFDLIIDEINTIPHFTVFYAKHKTTVLIHQLAREYWFTQTFWPASLVGYWLEPIILKLYSKLPTIAVSKSTKKDLVKLNFVNVKVIREGLDLKPQLPPRKDNLIVFIGRLTKAKGPQDAILAFKIIHDNLPKTKLVIIGKGEEKFTTKLKTLVKKLKLVKKVKFTGYAPQKDKVLFLKKAKVVLIPSVREGWNLVATEANARGAVPVAYNVAGLRDSIRNGENGLLVDTNPASLANATLAILKNEAQRAKIAEEGFLFSQNFSWENCYSDIRNFIFGKMTKSLN